MALVLLRLLLVDDRLQWQWQLQRQLRCQLVRLRQRVRVVGPDQVQRQQCLRSTGGKVDRLLGLLLRVLLVLGLQNLLAADDLNLLQLLLLVVATDGLRKGLRLLQVLVLVHHRVDRVGQRRTERGRRQVGRFVLLVVQLFLAMGRRQSLPGQRVDEQRVLLEVLLEGILLREDPSIVRVVVVIVVVVVAFLYAVAVVVTVDVVVDAVDVGDESWKECYMSNLILR